MKTKIASAAAALGLAWQAHGLDVSGKVMDKFENPLAGARICLQGAGTCVVSGADGSFRYADGATALRPVAPGSVAASLRPTAGGFVFQAPAPGRVRFEWFTGDGRRAAPGEEAEVGPAGFSLAVPRGLAAAFLRASGPGYRVTWKIHAGIVHRAGGTDETVASPLAAAKLAAEAATLEITKEKYQAKAYAASRDTETGVVIELRPLGDKVLFGGAGLDAWGDHSNGAWKVADGVLFHRGGSGALYTKENFGNFRLVTTSRKPGGGHNPNFLLWCKPGSTDKRTLGGIQFQPPLGHMWDYVANKDPRGMGTMTRIGSTAGLKVEEWARCESLAQVSTATIRFACCNLEGTKKTCSATEIVRFTDPKFARSGPIALMIHDTGQQQDYKDIEIEVDPIEPGRLLSVKAP